MPILPNYNLDDIPSEFESLPHGRYRISLLKVKKLYAKRPYLGWCWVVVDGDSELLGEKLVSYTGIGTKESSPMMNGRLRRQFKAFGLEYTAGFNTKELLHQQVTIHVDTTQKGYYAVIRMMPAKYYEYSPTWKPYGWFFSAH